MNDYNSVARLLVGLRSPISDGWGASDLAPTIAAVAGAGAISFARPLRPARQGPQQLAVAPEDIRIESGHRRNSKEGEAP